MGGWVTLMSPESSHSEALGKMGRSERVGFLLLVSLCVAR